MLAPRPLLAVILFAVLCLIALALTGLLNWISSLLFLTLELLAEGLRRVIARAAAHGAHTRARARFAAPRAETRTHRVWRKAGRRRCAFGRRRKSVEATAHRLLLPLHGDQPELIAFAIDECRERRAELLVLFVRRFAVVPMGPVPLPDPNDDVQANALLERVTLAAAVAGVTLRTVYRCTSDVPGAILDVAQVYKADMVVMEARRGNRLWRVLLGDEVEAVRAHLHGPISLLLHAA